MSKAVEFIRDHWPIAAAVGAGCIAWGTVTAQIASIAKVQERVEAKLDTITEGLAVAKTRTDTTAVDIADLRVRLHALEVRR